MSDDELDRIFIRAKIVGKWGSYSLRYLIAAGQGGQIDAWFYDRLFASAGLHEGEVVDESVATRMVECLRRNGVGVLALRADLVESLE